MKRREGIVSVKQDPTKGAYPYGRISTGKKSAGKRPVTVSSHYKDSTIVQDIKVGPRTVHGVRRPKAGHHIDIKKAPIHWEQNGKRVGIPEGKKQRRGEKGKGT